MSNDNTISPELIDFPALYERVGDDKEFVQELIQIFLENGALLMEKLVMFIGQGSLSEVGPVAHELKGMCLNMEVRKMHMLAERLEKATRYNSGEDPRPLVSQLTEEFNQLRTCLSSL